jgi:hypothetical protein
MKNVYLLCGENEYEGQYPLGVYSSVERAKEARDAYKGGYDRYTIEAVELDAAPLEPGVLFREVK